MWSKYGRDAHLVKLELGLTTVTRKCVAQIWYKGNVSMLHGAYAATAIISWKSLAHENSYEKWSREEDSLRFSPQNFCNELFIKDLPCHNTVIYKWYSIRIHNNLVFSSKIMC